MLPDDVIVMLHLKKRRGWSVTAVASAVGCVRVLLSAASAVRRGFTGAESGGS